MNFKSMTLSVQAYACLCRNKPLLNSKKRNSGISVFRFAAYRLISIVENAKPNVLEFQGNKCKMRNLSKGEENKWHLGGNNCSLCC